MNQTGVALGVPGADMHSVPANIGLQFFPAGRPDFQIILQQHGLPVQSELKFRICPQNFQKRIHHVHQADSKRLKWGIPFPVPVSMGNDKDMLFFVSILHDNISNMINIPYSIFSGVPAPESRKSAFSGFCG